MSAAVRRRLHVDGTVQGVGFRPFVHNLAGRLGLSGFVGNDPAGVVIEIEGAASAVTSFADALRREAPELAAVDRVRSTVVAPRGEVGFAILASAPSGDHRMSLPPDTAPCAACLAEITDATQRRHRYPFTNCTACGPRYTIAEALPYDRARTTMASFPMCGDCAAEYGDPADRRFHAQPICCPACGPTLTLEIGDASSAAGGLVAEAVNLLRSGSILAVKGVGGYHLACAAGDGDAVGRLRERKHREERPFAVLVADLPAARELCAVDAAEAAVLESSRRPIVLLDRLPGAEARVAAGVAPRNRALGLLLPPTPLHALLAAELAAPMVLTSGNRSSEPIAHRDEDARERLTGIADAFLTHNRPIHVRLDDSVIRLWRGAELPLRRARGYAPAPIGLARPVPRPILACGAELKSTFCLAVGMQAVVSQHLGDLEDWETHRAFTEGIGHLERLLDLTPELVAHDLHPDYLSTRYALDREGVHHVGVQHHHAHIASCLADNGVEGPVIGVALDGTGLGSDGTIWGGELLVADLLGFQRVGHLGTVAMPGGAAAIREPWRMAVAWLDAAFDGDPPPHPVALRNESRVDAVRQLARTGLQAPLTSSAGRLFDAVAALLGVRDAVSYEGQAAIELEQLAAPDVRDGYGLPLPEGDVLVLPAASIVRAVVADQRRGVDGAVIAGRFHRTLADLLVAAVVALRARTGLGTAALSGGVFQNVLLLDLVVDGLEAEGFRVLTHRRVPPNDGGISLGQAAVAGARDVAGEGSAEG